MNGTYAMETVITELQAARGERVLLVDDSQDICTALNDWLSRAGYECLAASNVDDAIRLIEAEGASIALVITDIFMRERTGFDLLAFVKQTRPNLGVLMLTGSAAPHLATQAMTHGAWG